MKGVIFETGPSAMPMIRKVWRKAILSIIPRGKRFSLNSGENHILSPLRPKSVLYHRRLGSCRISTRRDYFDFRPLLYFLFLRFSVGGSLNICCDGSEWLGIPIVPWLKPILGLTITKLLFWPPVCPDQWCHHSASAPCLIYTIKYSQSRWILRSSLKKTANIKN